MEVMQVVRKMRLTLVTELDVDTGKKVTEAVGMKKAWRKHAGGSWCSRKGWRKRMCEGS